MNSNPFAELALRSYERGDYASAIVHYRQAIDSDTSLDGYRVNLAHVLMLSERFQEAVVEYRSIIERLPDDVLGYWGLADALFALGDHDEAICQLRTGVARAPTYVLPLIRLAQMLELTGDRSAAFETSAEARRLLTARHATDLDPDEFDLLLPVIDTKMAELRSE
jgi:tetratricopeptide (TPR) repeat protein